MHDALPTHPRTGLRAVGIVAGRPVWPVLGASPDDPSNEQIPAETTEVVTETEPVEKPAEAEEKPADGAAPAEKGEEGDGKVYGQAYVERLRKEAANHRTAKGEQETARKAAEQAAAEKTAENEKLTELLDGFRKLLDPDAGKDDQPLTPEQYQAKLTELEQSATKQVAEKDAEIAQRDDTIRQLRIENALPSVFSKVGVKPGLTTKVLKADGVLAQLDPSAETFTADLESAVKKALAEDASLKATQAVTRTGTEPTGRAGATDQITSLEGMTAEQIVEARKAGRLKKLLGG